MGIMLLRDGETDVDTLAIGFCDYFRTKVMPGEIRTLYTRMVERNWIAVDASDSRRIVVTEAGHALLLSAFTGLIRLVDEGHGALEISLLFSLATRRLPDDDD